MSHATALLVIDVQIGQLEGPKPAYQGEAVLQRIQGLIGQARATGTPVIYVQHDGEAGGLFEVGGPGWPIHPAIAPLTGEMVVHKRAADSFYETSLHDELQMRGIGHLVVVGCKSQYCVDTTSRRATSLGYQVTLVRDAHTTVDSEILSGEQIVAHHNATLDDFGNEQHFITLTAANQITFPVLTPVAAPC
jgi:nicotinamidase-related amidase